MKVPTQLREPDAERVTCEADFLKLIADALG